jgi:calcineurin-like phosphoesterase family protein
MSQAPRLDPASTWLVSDTHFGHENIVGFCRRPHDHEQVIMEEWAQTVPDDGTVLHLGDLSYRNNSFFKNMIAKHLTGARKLLIQGNHDRQRPNFYRDSGFKIVKPFEIFYTTPKAGVWTVSFSHYPLKEPASKFEHVHIHGHIHNNGYGGKESPFIPFSAGQINISVEQMHYRPCKLDDLLNGYIEGCYEPPKVADE